MSKLEYDESFKQDKPTAIDLVDTELVNKWTEEQLNLYKELKLYDTEPWELNKKLFDNNQPSLLYQNEKLRFIAGLDISFIKNTNMACSGLFVFDLADEMNLVYQDLDTELIEMTQSYVPGYLAYREAPFLLNKLEKLKKNQPQLYPHCILIDGNGILHGNKFGMACHIGYFSDTPTIGVSKNLYQVLGLENNQEHRDRIRNELKKAGDYFELRSKENDDLNSIVGLCYRSTDKSTNPIYVSIGNKIGWETCLWVLKLVIKKCRIPEPVRHADLITREYLRKFDKF